jgi:hypothetical protein
LFLADSGARNVNVHNNPAEYTVTFRKPLRNVFSLQLIDAAIPRTEYAIDEGYDTFHINYIDDEGRWVDVNGAPITDKRSAQITIPPGDYTAQELAQAITLQLSNTTEGFSNIECVPLSEPSEITNKLIFRHKIMLGDDEEDLGLGAQKRFVLHMDSVSSLRSVLGFGDGSETSNAPVDTVFMRCSNPSKGCKSYVSVLNNGQYAIVPPGMVNLSGSRYVLVRCAEIEMHMYQDRSYEDHHAGLGMVRMGPRGYQASRFDFISFPPSIFHPIERISQLTFRIERPDGSLYKTRGVDHTLLFLVRYYEEELSSGK